MQSMGLAAPRRKTKYDIDPRNNAWANDENKFGQKLMEKFGWEKGESLSPTRRRRGIRFEICGKYPSGKTRSNSRLR